MRYHIFFYDMLGEMGAAVASEFIAAPISHIDTFSAIHQFLPFSISGIVVATPGTFDEGTEQIWVIAFTHRFGNRYLPDFMELFQRNIGFAVVEIVFVFSGVGLVFEQSVNFIGGGGGLSIFVLDILNRGADGIAGEVVGIGILDDGRDGHILYQSVVYDFVQIGRAHV